MKANKGEWSEFYAFLKILNDKKLFAADKNLAILQDKFFVFQKVIREESAQSAHIYDLTKSDTEIFITDLQGELIKVFEDKELNSKILKIFNKIKDESRTTFEIPEAEELMGSLLCSKIKAANSKKADIVAIIFDRISATMPELGFSVKSMIGGSSTLLNAGKTTNFIFKVEGFGGDVDVLNAIVGKSKIQDRLKALFDAGCKLTFERVESDTFEANLRKIDTVFPLFVSQMLVDFFSKKASTVKALTESLSINPELKKKYGLSSSDYEYKIKNFLDSVALGMVPSKVWEGFTQAHGGYIVVKKDGQVVCYHLYNRDEFRSYLYENTKFESASSTRHRYGSLYLQDGTLYFNLNLQIRFIK